MFYNKQSYRAVLYVWLSVIYYSVLIQRLVVQNTAGVIRICVLYSWVWCYTVAGGLIYIILWVAVFLSSSLTHHFKSAVWCYTQWRVVPPLYGPRVKRHCGLCLSLSRAPPPSGRPFTQPHCPKWDSVWLQLDSWQNTLSGHDSLVRPAARAQVRAG